MNLEPGRASDKGSAWSREDHKPAAQTLEIRIFILRRKELRALATLFAPFPKTRALVTQLLEACAGRRGLTLAAAISPLAAAGESSGKGCSDFRCAGRGSS